MWFLNKKQENVSIAFESRVISFSYEYQKRKENFYLDTGVKIQIDCAKLKQLMPVGKLQLKFFFQI